MVLRKLLLLSLIMVADPAFADDARYAPLDDIARAVMKEDAIPGMAIAIVDHNQTVVRAYGTREIHRDSPVTTHTAFDYGSTGKAFTALAIAMLQEQGALKLDDRIRDHIRAFEVEDPYVTANATILDALTHRTGTARSDFVWFGDPKASFDTVLKRMRYLPQRYSFRGGFEYSNLMYGVLDQIVAKDSGLPLDRFLAERVFKPLGMNDMTMSLATYRTIADIALPHAESADGIITMPRKTSAFGYQSATSPFVGSAEDGVRWLQFMIGATPASQRPIISRQALEATWERVTPMPDKGGPLQSLLFGDSPEVSYAQGWFVSDYKGQRALTHLGGADGMASLVSFLPERKVGIVILANLGGNMARAMLRNWVFDRALDIDATGEPQRYREWKSQTYEPLKAEALARDRARLPNAPSPLPLEAYAGRYTSNLDGEAVVVVAGDTLKVTINSRPPVVLKHWQDTTFELVWELANYNWPLRTLVPFHLDADGRVASLLLDGGGEQAEFRKVNGPAQ